MITTKRDRYDAFSMTLHWLAAIAVIAAFALGPGDFGKLVDAGVDPGTRIDIVAHESIGLIIFLLTVVRLLWVSVRPTPPSASGSDWAHIAAVAVRTVLWILLLATPVTAVLTLAGDHQPLTLLAGMRLDPTQLFGSWAWAKKIDWGDVHTFLGDAIVWVAGLHAAAALVHHFVWRDNVLRSMLPGRSS